MVNTSLDGGIEVGMPTMLAGSAGHFDEIEAFFKELAKFRPDFGYLPEPSKSVLIVRSPSPKRAVVL